MIIAKRANFLRSLVDTVEMAPSLKYCDYCKKGKIPLVNSDTAGRAQPSGHYQLLHTGHNPYRSWSLPIVASRYCIKDTTPIVTSRYCTKDTTPIVTSRYCTKGTTPIVASRHCIQGIIPMVLIVTAGYQWLLWQQRLTPELARLARDE